MFYRSLPLFALLLVTPCLVKGQDTIYVSDQAKSYLLFNAPVSLADVGNPLRFEARIEGNSILVVAIKDSAAATPLYAVVGGKPFTAMLLYKKHPQPFYDFRGKEEGTTAATTIHRLQQMQEGKDLRYASAAQDGIRLTLTGMLHDLNVTYLKFRVENQTSIVYQTAGIGFERLKRYRKGVLVRDKEAHFPLEAVAHVNTEQVLPYDQAYLYYALPLQAWERKEFLIATLREQKGALSGSRSVRLQLPARLLRKADLF